MQQIGQDLEDDVWDRVVALWRDPAGRGPRPGAPAAAASVREAIQDGSAVLLLVTAGPRLLGFAAVDRDLRGVRELHVRHGAPDGVARTLLLETALAIAQVRPPSPRPAPAAA